MAELSIKCKPSSLDSLRLAGGDAEASAMRAVSFVSARNERKRILAILTKEEKDTNNSYVSFDRIKALITG